MNKILFIRENSSCICSARKKHRFHWIFNFN